MPAGAEVQRSVPSGVRRAAPAQAGGEGSSKALTWGMAAAGLVLAVAGAWLFTHKPGEARRDKVKAGGTQQAKGSSTGTAEGKKSVSEKAAGAQTGTPEPKKEAVAAKPEEKAEPEQPKPKSSLFGGGEELEDIREGAARRAYDKILELEKSGQANSFDLRRSYERFLAGSYRNSKYGKEAEARFKALPPLERRPPDKPAAVEPGLNAKSFEIDTADLGLGGFSTAGFRPILTKVAANIDLPNKNAMGDQLTNGRLEKFVLQFTGFIDAPRDGDYVFATNSDDGSMLYIGDSLVVDNNGLHAMVKQSGSIPLQAGKHRIKVDFWQGDGDAGLIVSWSGPDIPEQTIPANVFFHAP